MIKNSKLNSRVLISILSILAILVSLLMLYLLGIKRYSINELPSLLIEFFFSNIRYILVLLLSLIPLLSIIIALYIYKRRGRSLIIYTLVIFGLSFFFGLFRLVVYQKHGIYSGVFIIIASFSLVISLFHLVLKKKPEIHKKTMTILGSLFFTIIVVELFLRILHIGSTYFENRFNYYESVVYQNRIYDYHTYKENSEHHLKTAEFDYIRSTNELGLTGIIPNMEDNDNSKLIIALGNSFTEGDGTHQDSTWLKFLEQELDSDGFENLVFMNAGVCGSDPIYEYKLLNDKLLKYNPDVVIVSYGYEIIDIITRGGPERFITGKPAISEHLWEPVYANSYLFRLIVHRLFGYNDLLMTKKEFQQAEGNAVDILKESLISFKELADKEGFELLIVFFPMKKEINNESFEYNHILYDFALENDINSLDLLQYFLTIGNINSKNSSDYYWKKDGHHNSTGYKKYAEGVYWKLVQDSLIKN